MTYYFFCCLDYPSHKVKFTQKTTFVMQRYTTKFAHWLSSKPGKAKTSQLQYQGNTEFWEVNC